jgi:hypothetical protein
MFHYYTDKRTYSVLIRTVSFEDDVAACSSFFVNGCKKTLATKKDEFFCIKQVGF